MRNSSVRPMHFTSADWPFSGTMDSSSALSCSTTGWMWTRPSVSTAAKSPFSFTQSTVPM